jgi:hypothetical protein
MVPGTVFPFNPWERKLSYLVPGSKKVDSDFLSDRGGSAQRTPLTVSF